MLELELWKARMIMSMKNSEIPKYDLFQFEKQSFISLQQNLETIAFFEFHILLLNPSFALIACKNDGSIHT